MLPTLSRPQQLQVLLALSASLAVALLFRRQISVTAAQLTQGAVPVLPSDPTPAQPSSRVVWPIRAGGTGNHGLSVTFLDPKYYDGSYGSAVKGYWHTGIDLNGPGAGNADVGVPVYAVADGIVEYAGVGGGTWGQIVMLKHVLPGGKVRWTRYGHIVPVVKTGDTVRAGQMIARIGRPSDWGADFTAHVHFDVMHTRPFRITDCP